MAAAPAAGEPAAGALDCEQQPAASTAGGDLMVAHDRIAQAPSTLDVLRYQIASHWQTVDLLRPSPWLDPRAQAACELCGHEAQVREFGLRESHCLFGGGRLVRLQCPACEVIFGDHKMLSLTPRQLAQEYEWHYRCYTEGDTSELEKRVFRSLEPRRSGIYLNYGAGAWSRAVQELRADGWNLLCYEPTASASAQAPWVINRAEDLLGHRFDGIFSNNVLEHFRSPVDALVEMRGLLAPGGRMAHATPCYEYRFEYTRFHLFFFPGRSRQLLADRAGLEILSFEVDGDFINCVMRPSTQPRPGVLEAAPGVPDKPTAPRPGD